MLHATLLLLRSTIFDGSHPAISAYTQELNKKCNASRSVRHRLCSIRSGRSGKLPRMIMPCEAKTAEDIADRAAKMLISGNLSKEAMEKFSLHHQSCQRMDFACVFGWKTGFCRGSSCFQHLNLIRPLMRRLFLEPRYGSFRGGP
jgi:hypothetical protein